jgi:succinoglycan biosynthesis protein ExoM
MINRDVHVNVCVVTCRQPDELPVLLRSLVRQRVMPALSYTVIVVDNDAQGSAREVTAAFAVHSEIPVRYCVEPEHNISMARNRALEKSAGDYVAFIDAHAIPQPDWLQNLVDMAQAFEADSVFGPVLQKFPQGTPAWIIHGGFFERPRYLNAVRVRGGSAANVLVRRACIQRFGAPFNPALDGEGSEFFHRLYRSGARYLWCDTAVVHESISADKFKLRYLAQHAFRSGQTHAGMTLAGYGALRRLRWGIGRASALAAALLGAALGWPMGRSFGVWSVQQVCSSLGQLSVLADQRFKCR